MLHAFSRTRTPILALEGTTRRFRLRFGGVISRSEALQKLAEADKKRRTALQEVRREFTQRREQHLAELAPIAAEFVGDVVLTVAEFALSRRTPLSGQAAAQQHQEQQPAKTFVDYAEQSALEALADTVDGNVNNLTAGLRALARENLDVHPPDLQDLLKQVDEAIALCDSGLPEDANLTFARQFLTKFKERFL